MKPSAYTKSDLAKGDVVEKRDQVEVIFAGGGVFHIRADGVSEHEVKRGSDKAWERAEALRLELNSDYSGPPSEGDENPPAPATEPQEGSGVEAGNKPPESPPVQASDDQDGGEDGDAPQLEEFTFGAVKALRALLPVNAVLDLLAAQAGRVAMLQSSDEARRLARRVRATDGRCAPVFLTKDDLQDPDEEPKLFDGLYTLACAVNVDMAKICVVMLPSREASKAQGLISAMMRASLAPVGDVDDDSLMVRVQNEE